MILSHRGNYWNTFISKQALQDIETYNIPDYVAEEFVNQFHDLGNWPEPCDCRAVQAIQRRDLPDGVLRFKPNNPPCLLQLRGIVLLFEIKGKKNSIVLAGIFVRNERTYEQTLTARMQEIGALKR